MRQRGRPQAGVGGGAAALRAWGALGAGSGALAGLLLGGADAWQMSEALASPVVTTPTALAVGLAAFALPAAVGLLFGATLGVLAGASRAWRG